jgi:hypothetical protein
MGGYLLPSLIEINRRMLNIVILSYFLHYYTRNMVPGTSKFISKKLSRQAQMR